MPAPQPPGPRRVSGADWQHVVQQSARGVHGEGADHPDRRQRAQKQQPATGADEARDQEKGDHQPDGPPALHPRVGRDFRQRDGAKPQPQQGEAKGGLQPEANPSVHVGTSASGAGTVRIQRWANAQNTNRKPTNSTVPP